VRQVLVGGLLGGCLLVGIGVWLTYAAVAPATQCSSAGSCGQVDTGLSAAGMVLIIVGFLGGLLVTIIAGGLMLDTWIDDVEKHAALRSRLQHAGVPALARIVSVAETGQTLDDAPLVDLVLEVTIEGRPAYQVSQRDLVPRLAVGRLTDGRRIQVLVDPLQPDQLVVEWLAQPRPAATGHERPQAGAGGATSGTPST
jgi:hypothetical protein